ncbi:DUF2934 domain-containing protein [Azospirillum rugosum]|uniref:DUF2934 domain-containing protein n=1 Tax=Azospirillum rugosum TaxID=416170 RepID=A0ABS4SWY2_9PROT|nr:DUF2934 domain-containing protein [Azospirillum rugosum]MBP2297045.1 hypothetical protein [Azospirillum rugosum]MDQ0530839.1 hypothetical protein [Azospirillum rugosum]
MEGIHEHVIRERAYSLWEREGRPEGRAAAHWFEAIQQLQAEGRIPRLSPTERRGERNAAACRMGAPRWGRRHWCRLSRRAA